MLDLIDKGQLVTAGNYMWMGMAAPITVLFVVLLIRKRPWGQAEWLMAGIALVAVAALAHRGYWTIWRVLVNAGESEMLTTWLRYENGLIFLSVITALGYVFHVKTYLEAAMGRFWWAYVMAYMSVMASLPFITGV